MIASQITFEWMEGWVRYLLVAVMSVARFRDRENGERIRIGYDCR